MLSIRPGQSWKRRSVPGADWRPVEVVNVLGAVVELRFLDMPGATDLQRVFSTNQRQMLLGTKRRQGPEYKFVRDAD
jgi:hypothetical protein